MTYLSSLHIANLLNAIPGGISQGLIWGVMALGLFFTYKVLGFSDLSVDGSFATGGATCVMLIVNGYSPVLAILISFLVGCLCGLITSLLNIKFGIPDILSGILTQISLYSINLNIMGKANQTINTRQIQLYITSNTIYLWRTIAILSVICLILVVLIYAFLGTELGCAIRATGANDAMAKAQGINTNNIKILTLMVSNGLVSMAGAVLSQYQGYADVSMGKGAIVIGLAAIIIGEVLGEAILKKHLNFAGRLAFVVIGAIVYYLVYILVIWLKFPPDDMKLLTAIVVAIFLAVPYLRAQSKSSFSHLAKMNKKMGGNK